MKTLLASCFGLFVVGLSAAPTFAGHHDACCAPACPEACRAASCGGKVCLHAEIIPHKYTDQVAVPPVTATAKTREEERNVVSCRMVPVCITDPCTGCTRTGYKQEQVVEKVKATIIDVCSTGETCPTYKPVEKVRNCINIYIENVPGCGGACAGGACCAQ